MRIIGGIHRSRRLNTPKSDTVRPTSDKVRQAVFNMLHSRDVVTDAFVLDAFCGTGALGLEALSQGAAHCIFVDKSRESINMARENITQLGEEERTTILHQDVKKIKEKPTDMPLPSLVFLDPPYRQNLIGAALHSLSEKGWLKADCMVVIETAKNETIHFSDLQIIQEKIYGDTKIILGSL
jgi:16S rRNA (guanine966-N2)-methyltransferase